MTTRSGPTVADPAGDRCLLRDPREYDSTVSEDRDERDLLSLLDDDYARAILVATSAEPMSAKQLSERCDVAPSTIYRRVDRLKHQDLIEERTQYDPDGHHRSLYESRLEAVNVAFEDGEYRVEIERREPSGEDVADRFTRLMEDI